MTSVLSVAKIHRSPRQNRRAITSGECPICGRWFDGLASGQPHETMSDVLAKWGGRKGLKRAFPQRIYRREYYEGTRDESQFVSLRRPQELDPSFAAAPRLRFEYSPEDWRIDAIETGRCQVCINPETGKHVRLQ